MLNFIKKNRKMLGLLLMITVGFFVVAVLPAQAAPSAETSSWLDPIKNGAVLAVGWIVKTWVWIIGQLCVLFVGIIISLAQYNDFVTSGAVTNGWVIIRDVVNMFFILILLVIAFAHIFNVSGYKENKILVRLLIMAVVINFSRTICGIFIDLGQVVMLTFVNGFQAAAGGNFIKALKIEELLQFNTNQTDPPDLMKIFASFILAAIMITITAVVLGAFIIMLVMRIVTLWFLVILSPLAFMLSVLPTKKSYYDDWWKMFLDNIMAGPILAFFLWLSLLVLGNGDISTAENISKSSASATYAQESQTQGQPSAGYTKIGTLDNMISYLMGIGMLLGALYMTQSMKSAGGEIAGKALGSINKYAIAGITKAGMAPVRATKWAGEAAYEKSGLRANVSALGTVIQTNKFAQAIGFGTKKYKDTEKIKREEAALRRFGKTGEADTKRQQIVTSEIKNMEEGNITGSTIRARLDKATKGTYEHEALARLAAKNKQINNSSEFQKYAGGDRKLEERLRTESAKAGNKDAFRGWVADPTKIKEYNKKKEAEDVYNKRSKDERRATYAGIDERAKLGKDGKVVSEFAAVDLSVIDMDDFVNFSEKIQKGILGAIKSLEKNSPAEFKEFGLGDKYNELEANAKKTPKIATPPPVTTPPPVAAKTGAREVELEEGGEELELATGSGRGEPGVSASAGGVPPVMTGPAMTAKAPRTFKSMAEASPLTVKENLELSENGWDDALKEAGIDIQKEKKEQDVARKEKARDLKKRMTELDKTFEGSALSAEENERLTQEYNSLSKELGDLQGGGLQNIDLAKNFKEISQKYAERARNINARMEELNLKKESASNGSEERNEIMSQLRDLKVELDALEEQEGAEKKKAEQKF